MKKNCWEVKNCERQVGGKNTWALGVCPATTETRLHGVHNGINAGRSCWIMSGTLCGGQVQRSLGEKLKKCQQCEFYVQVKTEEGNQYISSPMLIAKMNTTTEASL